MATRKPTDLNDDALAREVDKLLRKLPGADPYLRGEPEKTPVSGPHQGITRFSLPGTRVRVGVAHPTHRAANPIQRLTVWIRVCLPALLGAVVLQWPYGRACGFGLGFYLTGVVMIVLGGVWGGVWSWRYRMGLAHGAALAVICWGIALGSHEILQRSGYAAVSRSWSCSSR